jgi:hypothetical protein
MGHMASKFSLNRRSRLASAPAVMSLCCSFTLLAAPEPVVDLKELPKFPPVAAGDALKTFQLRNGFRLELVAAEPLVTEPIALAFDEDGRLFVVEMNDFPEGDKQHPGQVKRLEDTDGDGRFDKATVFADGLHWPSAVHCYGGGVFRFMAWLTAIPVSSPILGILPQNRSRSEAILRSIRGP